MRLSEFGRSVHLGGVTVHELQRVIELDSGAARTSTNGNGITLACQQIADIEKEMVIIVPCKNEPIGVIEGVLSGIPSNCFVILVSNSDPDSGDAYSQEMQALHQFCGPARRSAMVIHQRDPGVAAAFAAAGLPEVVDSTSGLVYNGKGEAMLMGMALAALTGRKYVGFVDADNFVPGSVHEYCRVFAAGLHLAAIANQENGPEESMVRISWACKPKLRNNKLCFERRGRSSRITNDWLNRIVEHNVGAGPSTSGIIATGNAGEHAMTIGLGLQLRFARGYAVEPFQFVDMFEGLSGSVGGREVPSKVRVVQIETRNPHFHDDKGETHVQRMWSQALNVLYHSSLTPRPLRQAMVRFMAGQGVLQPDHEPACERVYPPVKSLRLPELYQELCEKATTFEVIGSRAPAEDWPSSEPSRERLPFDRELPRDPIRLY